MALLRGLARRSRRGSDAEEGVAALRPDAHESDALLTLRGSAERESEHGGPGYGTYNILPYVAIFLSPVAKAIP